MKRTTRSDGTPNDRVPGDRTRKDRAANDRTRKDRAANDRGRNGRAANGRTRKDRAANGRGRNGRAPDGRVLQDRDPTRRDFLKGAAGVVLAGAASGTIAACHGHEGEGGKKPVPAGEGNEERGARKRARVVLIRDANVLGGNRKVDGKVLARMLDEGVTRLLGTASPEAAWKKLLGPGDTLGIKSNVWRFLPTPPELVAAIRERAVAAGVKRDRIAAGDRGVLRDPIFKEATALINARPMRTHHWAGVGSCIKNYIMFTPKPAAWHGDSCADLAGLWDLPEVKGKTRLNILVMLTPLFHGKGPHHFQAKYTWEYKGLVIGTDPVAVDATGVRILEAKREEYFGGDQPFAVPPKHIETAETKYGLGVADPERIEVIELGWKEGILI